MKSLTVIVPAYNSEKYLEKALKSIQGQSYKDFDCIIVNDGSTDKTSKIADQFIEDVRFSKIENSSNIGKPKSVDLAIAQSDSLYISIHDADDWSDPKRFEKQISFLEQNPQYVLCGTSFAEVDEKGNMLKEIVMPESYEEIRKNISYKSQFHGPTILFKREILENVGGLFRYMKMGEDIDFTMRVVEKYRALNLSEVLYYYRINNDSITKSYKHDLKSKIRDRYLIQRLRKEREENESDCLMRKDEMTFKNHLKEIDAHYEENKNYYLDEYISHLLSKNLYSNSIKTLIYRMRLEGLSFFKIKLLLFVLLKSIGLK